MHDLIKGNFIPAQMHTSCELLSRKFYGRTVGMVTDSNGVKVELLTLVKSIMFPAVVSHLFSDDILPQGKVWLSTDSIVNDCCNYVGKAS